MGQIDSFWFCNAVLKTVLGDIFTSFFERVDAFVLRAIKIGA
jgi:hypothetical protein